jgi:deoxycytidine triphosphate deaminase
MKLLTDREIKAKIDSPTQPLITGISTEDWQSKKSSIQACSVDLHIGRIQIPSETGQEHVREFSRSGDDHFLETGQTAVLTTIETLNMPANIAGFGFPPSKVSIKGLLMTNPGHVDPGYNGPMHFTVINMGRTAYSLRIDDPICTILFFELDSCVEADWHQRRGAATNTSSSTPRSNGLDDQDVNRLAKDFVDVEKRAKIIAKDAVRKAQWTAGVLAALVSISIALVSQFVPYYLTDREELKKDYAVTSKDIEYLKEQIAVLSKQQLSPPISTPQKMKGDRPLSVPNQ